MPTKLELTCFFKIIYLLLLLFLFIIFYAWSSHNVAFGFHTMLLEHMLEFLWFEWIWFTLSFLRGRCNWVWMILFYISQLPEFCTKRSHYSATVLLASPTVMEILVFGGSIGDGTHREIISSTSLLILGRLTTYIGIFKEGVCNTFQIKLCIR